jgi:uncharacterized phage protein gp47/JayE
MITIPTTIQLYNNILTSLEAQYGVSISLFGKVVLRAFSAVQAAKFKLYYLAIGNLQKNIFVDTADSESVGGTLERFGRVKLGRNPYPAVAGTYSLTVNGSIGGIIKAGTTFKSDDSSSSPGFLFVLDNDYTLVATTDVITVRALASGTESKLSVLDTLTPTSPIALVDSGPSSVYISAITIEPLASEDLEAYRLAIINSYRLEAKGGAATDYRLWSADAQGVRYVYPYATSGATGEVDLYIEATVADSTDGKGTPSAQLLLDVEEVIDFDPDATIPLLERGRRPIQVIVNYMPVTIKEVDIIITGYLGNTPTIMSLLLSAITDAINNIRPFVDAADVLVNKNDVLDINKIIGVIITQTPGAVFSSVTIKIDNVAMSTYTFVNGNIPHLNTVTYN